MQGSLTIMKFLTESQSRQCQTLRNYVSAKMDVVMIIINMTVLYYIGIISKFAIH